MSGQAGRAEAGDVVADAQGVRVIGAPAVTGAGADPAVSMGARAEELPGTVDDGDRRGPVIEVAEAELSLAVASPAQPGRSAGAAAVEAAGRHHTHSDHGVPVGFSRGCNGTCD